jgi:3-hydroxymyristoyl/3-hydroxydecanoyl-(acyl carrier protein) dehydratase
VPPYLLVSRVTEIEATRGQYKPSRMVTEYDVPIGAWYGVDGQVPTAVAIESGQCDLLLISYLGIDFENKGDLIYRLLDCTITFLDNLPREGQTLRYEIQIDSFARSGDNLLFFFRYDCFVGDKMVLKMRGGCAGFFSDAELARGKGVIYTESELAARARAVKRSFTPPLACKRRAFDRADLDALSAGNPRAVFGAAWEPHGLNPSLRLPPSAIRMLDRVVEVDPTGGVHGLGTIVAEKDLRPDDWYFPCHFKDDEVLAGSLMAEGCVQLMQFYLLYLGVQTRTQNARFEPIPGLAQVVRCRGQVIPKDRLLTYRLEVTDVGLEPRPYAKADVEVVLDGKVIVHFKDLGLQLVDEPAALARLMPEPRKPALLDERHVYTFATGRLADAFGPEYAIYDGRPVSRQPNGELQLISRILEVQGKRGDLRPGSRLVSEFDVPSDAWFLEALGDRPAPFSILMELGLQPCGFLSAYLGSTLPFPDEEFHFRNLDGTGRLLRPVDLRGKTVTNRVRLLTSTSIQGVVLQSFEYQLACDGEPFFEGDAAFGYFSTASLANQVGLDAGQRVPAWLASTSAVPTAVLDLREVSDASHFDLLDRVTIFADGGRHGVGYVHGFKAIDPTDWFYACHFFQDPVMPGSLGIEAMIQALKLFARGRGLRGEHVSQPTPHTTTWKYRGQIVPADRSMSLELHVKRVETTNGRTVVVADGSLWRDNLRIYEVTDLAVALVEGNPT